MTRSRLLICLLGTALVACDASLAVSYVNETPTQVTVYPYGLPYTAGKRVIAPGQRAGDTLLANGGDSAHMARVEAYDADGVLIFCHSYKVGELRGLSGVVPVVTIVGFAATVSVITVNAGQTVSPTTAEELFRPQSTLSAARLSSATVPSPSRSRTTMLSSQSAIGPSNAI